MELQVTLNWLAGSVTILLFALGLSFVVGYVKIINFAHGEFYMLGAFVVWIGLGDYYVSIPGPPIIVYFASLVAAVVIVGGLGALAERLVFRPMKGDLLSSFMVSLGLIFVLQTSARLVFGVTHKSVPNIVEGSLRVLGASLSWQKVLVAIVAVVMTIALYWLLVKTKMGRALRSVAQDTEGAAIQGISIRKSLALAMFIGCGLAAAAGALIGPIFFIDPYIGEDMLMKAFAIVVIGGLGSLPGTVLGSFIVGFVASFGGAYLGDEVAAILIFCVLFVVLIVKPWGVMGHAEQ